MPQYKDIDAILNRLPNDLPYKSSVKRVLIQAPEADVVPKSEFDRVYHNLRAVLEERAETRAEIAREIFDELEFDIHQLMFEREETRAIAIEGVIAELKKKYIHRECPKCKYFVGCERANWVRGCDEYTEGEV